MFPIVFLEHPGFLGSQSMQRFAAMLRTAFAARGYPVQSWAPRARLQARLQGTRLAKWAGYVDQYLLFPLELRRRVAAQPADTLFVFCDQALGPWVPQVAHRPHVVHCHDLLALRSAQGRIAENPTRWTGRVYQRWIRAGFRRARHFVSVSRHTQQELEHELDDAPRPLGAAMTRTSEVVYNGLDPAFGPMPADVARQALRAAGIEPPAGGFLLHVGGDQWYKNRAGLLQMYAAFVNDATAAPPSLWLVGPPPDATLNALIAALPSEGRVVFHAGLSNETLAALYSQAAALLFPSLAEGFGWPIAEALACGCPVITTGEAPMTEVGGDAAVYLPRMPADEAAAWAGKGARALAGLLGEPKAERDARRQRGFEATQRFESRAAIDAYEAIYRRVQALELAAPQPLPRGAGA